MCISQEDTDNKKRMHLKVYTNFRYDENRDLLSENGVLSNIEQNNYYFGKISIALEKNFNTR